MSKLAWTVVLATLLAAPAAAQFLGNTPLWRDLSRQPTEPGGTKRSCESGGPQRSRGFSPPYKEAGHLTAQRCKNVRKFLPRRAIHTSPKPEIGRTEISLDSDLGALSRTGGQHRR